MRGIEHEALRCLARLPRELRPLAVNDHVRRHAAHFDQAPDPPKRHAIPPPLEAHQTVSRDAPGYDDIERLVHGGHGLEMPALLRQRVAHAGAGARTPPAIEQLVAARIERRLQRLE